MRRSSNRKQRGRGRALCGLGLASRRWLELGLINERYETILVNTNQSMGLLLKYATGRKSEYNEAKAGQPYTKPFFFFALCSADVRARTFEA